MEILPLRMNYAHEVVGTHGGARLLERVPGAKTPVCISLKYRICNINAFS